MTLWDMVSRSAGPRTTLYLPAERNARYLMRDVLGRAEATAAEITARLDGRPPRRVGLLLSNGEPWVRALLSVLRLNATAVPLPLPAGFAGFQDYARHLERIVTDAQLDAIVVDHSFGPGTAARIGSALAHPHVLDVTVLGVTVPAGQWHGAIPAAANDGTAVIQYTSGSTSQPKGVVLSDSNVATSLAGMREACEVTSDDIFGVWVPLFHDMGLFGLLMALAGGASVALWRPTDFIRRPMNWLAQFAATGVTGMGSPNFGYDYLVDGVARHGLPAGLDLSSWRFAVNGAEPVQFRTLEAFTRTFTPHGLRPGLFRPAYGMAEATLMVTYPRPGSAVRHVQAHRDHLAPGDQVRLAGPATPSQSRRVLVSCGGSIRDMHVRITAADGQDGAGSGVLPAALPEATIGGIEIKGKAVTSGYLNLPPDQQPITADGWLRTGDLGFLLDGELFVTGRMKDMIIIRGQNYYAEDVEDVVRTTPGIDRRVCVAVSHQADRGELVLVLWETRLGHDEAAAAARRIEERVRTALGLGAIRVISVPPSAIPHTTSGKVRRASARQLCEEIAQ